MQSVIRWLGNPLLNRGGEYKMAQAFSELMITTRESALTLEMMGKKGLRAGDRVREADLVKGTETTKLYDLLYAGGWTLWAFTGTQKPYIQDVSDALGTFEHEGLSRYIISTDSRISSQVSVLYDLDEIAHRVYSVTKPTFYLIRPDGYVGARVSPKDIHHLKKYIERWIPTDALILKTESVR